MTAKAVTGDARCIVGKGVDDDCVFAGSDEPALILRKDHIHGGCSMLGEETDTLFAEDVEQPDVGRS